MTVVRANTTWYQTQYAACCLTKDETYESYSPWKGHCFAQLPSAGAAWGVESQIDKSEMTLKQRQEGCRLFVCPLDKVGVEETQSRAAWLVCALLTIAVKWLNKGRAIKKRATQERNERNDCAFSTGFVVLHVCVSMCARYILLLTCASWW